MKERPILFQPWKVRSILEWDWSQGNMQTRRVIKPQPDILMEDVLKYNRQEWPCPYGEPGDRLWVKETFKGAWEGNVPARCSYILSYRADNAMIVHKTAFLAGYENWPDRWRSSRFMPRWASRIMLEIVNIRVERVQEITLMEVKKEGVFEWGKDRVREGVFDGRARGIPYPVNAFAELWNSINAKRGYGWDVNPWLWVVEFKRSLEGGLLRNGYEETTKFI